MKIYIEVAVVLGIVITFFCWSLWHNYSTNKLRRKYDEQRAGQPERSNPFSTEDSSSTTRLTQSEGRSFVQTTGLNAKGKDSNSTRKSSSFFRKFQKS